MRFFIGLLGIFISGLALASIPNSDGSISACYSTLTGGLRVINGGTSCGLLEHSLTLKDAPNPRVFDVTITATPITLFGDFEGGYLSSFNDSFTLNPGEYAYLTVTSIWDFTNCSDGSPSATVDFFLDSNFGLYGNVVTSYIVPGFPTINYGGENTTVYVASYPGVRHLNSVRVVGGCVGSSGSVTFLSLTLHVVAFH